MCSSLHLTQTRCIHLTFHTVDEVKEKVKIAHRKILRYANAYPPCHPRVDQGEGPRMRQLLRVVVGLPMVDQVAMDWQRTAPKEWNNRYGQRKSGESEQAH